MDGAEHLLAAGPAALPNHRGHPLVEAGGIDSNRCAETRAAQADALRIDLRAAAHEVERRNGVIHLPEWQHPATLAPAFTAALKIEPQHGVAEARVESL